MSRSALVLAAHGSHHQPAVNELVLRLAKNVGIACGFDETAAAFHQGEPSFSAVLDGLTADNVVVVPMMTSAGYYANEVLPRELRRNRRFDHCSLRITPPVGTHADIAPLILALTETVATEASARLADASLVIVGHGTRRNPNSRKATDDLVANLNASSQFGQVFAAFLDQDPEVDTIAARAKFPVAIVIPFLIGGGPHAMEDIPRRVELGDTSSSPPKRFLFTPPVGTQPGIANIVRKLATNCQPGESSADAAPRASRLGSQSPASSNRRSLAASPLGRNPLRLGTRGSKLAMWQAEHVASQLAPQGVDVEFVAMSTVGDRDQSLPIVDFPVDAPFTDDIDAAVLSGDIDLAVHSLKDLPISLRPGLTIGAILARGSAGECLISRARLKLSELGTGTAVGTSSLRRRAQLAALRPDLQPVPLRGAVDERLRKVFAGELDAAILAVAGIERLGRLDAISERFDLDLFFPAPGQGALAVVVRDEGGPIRDLVASLDHRPTRLAAEAELAAFRPFEHARDFALAAYAVTENLITLSVRLLSSDGKQVWNARSRHANASNTAELALAALARQGAPIPTEVNS